jgi:hypothetical protein
VYRFYKQKKLCENENCQECFDKSFASHEKSIYWNEINTIKPRQIFKGSSNAYYFNCDKCNHKLLLRIDNIVYLNNWCKYCSNQSLCEDKNCIECFNKSFASHEKSIYWSNRNKITPRQVFKNTIKKYLLNCEDCNHELNMSLNNVSKGAWCKYCNINVLCDNNKCNICFNKSFASHEKITYWSNKNVINPRNITKHSDKKYIFLCNICNNDFNISPRHISENKWCKFCKKKSEKKLLKILKQDYNDLICQYYTDWCKNNITNRKLPYDFLLPTQKIIIELDGIQHFKQVSNWKSPEEQFIRDIYKIKCANDNGFSVIRIFQEDVFNDKYDWYNELKKNIIYLSNINNVENVYICKSDLYDKFKINLKQIVEKA